MGRSGRHGRAGALRSSRVRAARWVPAALAGVVIVGALVAAGWLGNVPARSVALDDGSAWLVSSVGQAALVDGSSAQVVAQVTVPSSGSGAVAATQSGADAYVSNTADGSVRRVDGATFAVSGGVRFASPGEPLAVYAGRQALFAIGERTGSVSTADPRTLRKLRDDQSLAARIPAGGALVDGAGRLWVVDGDTGKIVRLDAAGRHDVSGSVDPARSTLVPIGDRVAVVDLGARTVRTLGDGGVSAPVACVDARAGDNTVRVAGSATGDHVYAVSGQRGVLLVSNLSQNSCENTVIDLKMAGNELGAPREAAGKVFVPNLTTGQVSVVDIASRSVVTKKVLDPPARFELVPQGSFVFYNDPATARAGVIRLDGSVREIRKYDPKNPGVGVVPSAGSGNQTAPTPIQPPVTPWPTASPTPRLTASPTGQPPKGDVQIQLSATEVTVNQPVALRVVATNGGIVASVTWTFGDDAPAFGVQVSHSWPKPGIYTVQALTRLADGRQATPTATITVVADTQPVVPPTPHPTDSPDHPTATPTRTATPTPTPTPTADQFTLSLTILGTGTVTGLASGPCTSLCQATFPAGQQVTLTANPGSGNRFDNWSGAPGCATAATCTVTMDKFHDVTAQFSQIQTFQLTVSNPGAGGSVTGNGGIDCPPGGGVRTCTALYTAGTRVTLSATPASGQTFSGWSGDCTGTGTCTVTMDKAHNVTATFTAQNRPVHSSGTIDLPSLSNMDLDAGAVAPCCGSAGADAWLHGVGTNLWGLAPMGSAGLAVMPSGSSALTYADCAGAALSGAEITTDNLPAGTRLCARTQDGRFSALRVVKAPDANSNILTISYTTWE
ncbi:MULTISPECIES: InlB B-repeat-containing protein [unclassified Frankia]|uniref:InlB B-repeat-containing protein n=1 Tax=unclassified Frankia TaxID=2632575 RepID=UPI002AD2A296|nr:MULTISPECIES: PKD domain-containing protein [unclassified Frankia]